MPKSSALQKLPRLFYARDTQEVAKDLLGKYLVHVTENFSYIGKIVEVEAYLGPHDLAAHSSKGQTKRTKIMFGPPGYAYVYLVYGIHYCFNVVTEGEGSGSAILIRAVEPIQHITTRTQGPGLVCKAMQISLALNGCDLEGSKLYLAFPPSPADAFTIVQTTRIGIAYAKEWVHEPLRFYIANNKFISRK